MANLRADNLTGTGGRNAIDGSVFFDSDGHGSTNNSNALSLADSNDWYFDGDFTFECWINPGKRPTTSGAFLGQWVSGGGTDRNVQLYIDTNGVVTGYMNRSTTNYSAGSVGALSSGEWSHIALVLESSTLRFYWNGKQTATASVSGTQNNGTSKFFVGAEANASGNPVYAFNGYLSNVRVIKGTALYAGGTTFTPPTEKLTVVDGTVLLCCQDSDDPTQEATGKTITGYGILGGDKSEGNLLTNTLDWGGAASSYSTTMPDNWTAGNGAQVQYESGGTSGGGANRKLRLRNDGSSSYIYQTIPTVIGQKYQIDLWYEAQNSSLAVKWSAGTSAAATTNGYEQWNVGSDGTQATRTGTFIASATTTYITFQIISGTNDASVFVDDIQVKAVNPKAPKVIPSVGVDEGVVFNGDTKVNSKNYMYFPTGTTEQRGRGRGVMGGGETPSKTNALEYINIQSMGTAKDFGDFTITSGDVKGLGSSTRGVFRVDNNPSSRNVLEYITFATTSNSTDFGDLNVAVQQRPGASNQTRGIFSGGLYPGSTVHNDMDYITIASTGNAADFGNLSVARGDTSALASPTRMVVGGGITNPGSVTYHNEMDYVTIATTGNATDFGDLTVATRSGTAVASSTRGVFGPGKAPSLSNTIDYITIASTGNATDFGDALLARGGAASVSNSIRGLFAGGYTPSKVNGIEFITIATTGNGADFGDMTFVSQYGGGCSDSHGGIS